MVNILGAGEGYEGLKQTFIPINRALSAKGILVILKSDKKGATVHWYGKKEVRKQRKMGHITVVGDSFAEISGVLKRLELSDFQQGWDFFCASNAL